MLLQIEGGSLLRAVLRVLFFVVFPLRFAIVAFPAIRSVWQRNADCGRSERRSLVNVLVRHIQRAAFRAARLFVVFAFSELDALWDWLVQHMLGSVRILRMYHELYAANRVRIKPVHTDHVVVAEERLNPC